FLISNHLAYRSWGYYRRHVCYSLLWLFSCKVVLANGEVIKTGSRARKSAAGYVVDSLD
ncbi:hypothetical protein BHE74_00003400, partial [Ensete ventricosum]